MEKTPSVQASGSGRKQLSVVLGGIPVQVCGTQSRGEEGLGLREHVDRSSANGPFEVQ